MFYLMTMKMWILSILISIFMLSVTKVEIKGTVRLDEAHKKADMPHKSFSVLLSGTDNYHTFTTENGEFLLYPNLDLMLTLEHIYLKY